MKTKFKTSPESQKKSILENRNFLNNQNYILGKKNIDFIKLKEIYNNEIIKNKRMTEYNSKNDFYLLIEFIFKICFNIINFLYLFEKRIKVNKEIIFIVINFLIIKFIIINLFNLFIDNLDNLFFILYFLFFLLFITLNTYILTVYFLNKNKRVILIRPNFENINELDYIIIFKK